MHMRDMLHCRLPIGNEDDFFEEYGDYYDFSNALTEEEKKNVGTAELLETGEVLLRSADGKTGRILGSRHFKHIYRQNVKTEDERASVVAAKRAFRTCGQVTREGLRGIGRSTVYVHMPQS